MEAMSNATYGDVRAIAAMERRLASTLGRTRDEVSRADCFDSEQRAEVYAILEALQADTEAHKRTIKFLTPRLDGQAHDA